MCMVAGAMAAFFTTALAQPSLPRSVGGVRRSAGAGDSPPASVAASSADVRTPLNAQYGSGPT